MTPTTWLCSNLKKCDNRIGAWSYGFIKRNTPIISSKNAANLPSESQLFPGYFESDQNITQKCVFTLCIHRELQEAQQGIKK